MASLAKFVWSAFRGTRTTSEEAGPSSTRPVGGPFTTGVPCNPEDGVGLLAAVAEPASSRLRVANRTVVNTAAAGTSRGNKSCRLCSYSLDGRTIYIYKSMEFCTMKCRFHYFMRGLYDRRYRELVGGPAGRNISAEVKAWLVPAQEERRLRRRFFG